MNVGKRSSRSPLRNSIGSRFVLFQRRVNFFHSALRVVLLGIGPPEDDAGAVSAGARVAGVGVAVRVLAAFWLTTATVSYTHLRAHETSAHL
eukprot:9769826-Alexandrium_andersonii.AAC.1